MSGYVFISYSRQDSGYVQRLVAYLRDEGIPVWIDEEIDFGDRWEHAIRSRVDECRVLVPVMSPHSEGSSWVAREISRADARSKPIVPLLLDGDVFFRLSDRQFEDVRDGEMPRSDFVATLRRAIAGGLVDIQATTAVPAQTVPVQDEPSSRSTPKIPGQIPQAPPLPPPAPPVPAPPPIPAPVSAPPVPAPMPAPPMPPPPMPTPPMPGPMPGQPMPGPHMPAQPMHGAPMHGPPMPAPPMHGPRMPAPPMQAPPVHPQAPMQHNQPTSGIGQVPPPPQKRPAWKIWVPVGASALAVVLVITIVAAVLGGGGGGEIPPVVPPVNPTIVEVAVDLPFQGEPANVSEENLKALQLYLDQAGGKAGRHTVTLTRYDNSTEQANGYNMATCTSNAQDHLAKTAEVAILGPADSDCTTRQLMTLNARSSNTMLMVSHWNVYPGLTKAWDEGEPEDYYPSGVRNYGRVMPTSDNQATAAAQYAARELYLTKCFVLDDSGLSGSGLATAFVREASKQPTMDVVGQVHWSASASTYVDLFTQAKAAGADCVFAAGSSDSNAVQLIKDKVATLGPNADVPLLMSPAMASVEVVDLPETDGAYVTEIGLDLQRVLDRSTVATAFAAAYKAKYGRAIEYVSTFYALQALQVIMAAIEGSDGTREGVRNKVFTAPGVTVAEGKSILGRAIALSPETGDCSLRDVLMWNISKRDYALADAVTVP